MLWCLLVMSLESFSWALIRMLESVVLRKYSSKALVSLFDRT